MKRKLILIGLIIIAGLGIAFLQIQSNIKPRPEQSLQINLQWQTYTEPNAYSLHYPPNWIVERSRRELVMIMSQPPVKNGTGKFPHDLIKTDIRIEPSSFESLANQISNPEMEKVIRKEQVTINNSEALTLWMRDRFGANSVVTLIRYKPDETIYIASFYTADNTTAPQIIQNLHGSLRVSE